MIQWTELLPKSLGVRYNMQIAAWAARPLQFLIKLMHPLVALTNWLNRPFTRQPHGRGTLDAVQDIAVLARFAAFNNLLSKAQADILARTVGLSKIYVKDVMVEREEIKTLSTSMSLTDALIYAHIHHHTRLPLLDEATQAIIGYVNFKDIVSVLQINPRNPSLQGICRPMLAVYEDDLLPVILNKLTKGSQHIALVRNRQEQIRGIVTMEDLIEAVIGEISDEYDLMPAHFYQITPSRYVAGGGILLPDLQAQLPLALPNQAITLSAWLKTQCDCRIPKIEEQVTHGDAQFIVRKISRSNIHEVIIQIKPA